ncbi:hypothetical protein DM01DRAFT_1056633 [Hesseltinella vesiculosa]|uniref:Uncharacterized protein n=1 Tax=Hesseltinella vesiculosa TaxID=101127 RepID=A0A1X2GFV2_9FUNG|nr:hypothetical protein DM01DRAFT_1056633 [Hesseltinella vesiculosa]
MSAKLKTDLSFLETKASNFFTGLWTFLRFLYPSANQTRPIMSNPCRFKIMWWTFSRNQEHQKNRAIFFIFIFAPFFMKTSLKRLLLKT